MASRAVEIAAKTVAVLVPFVVEKQREMTFGELSKAIASQFDDNVPAWHDMANPLGKKQESYKELSLPNFPVMVVNQQTLRPVDGWYAQFYLLYPELAILDNIEIICGFDSKKTYGVPGIVEVHRPHPLADGGARITDLSKDLIPICPNCHKSSTTRTRDYTRPTR